MPLACGPLLDPLNSKELDPPSVLHLDDLLARRKAQEDRDFALDFKDERKLAEKQRSTLHRKWATTKRCHSPSIQRFTGNGADSEGQPSLFGPHKCASLGEKRKIP